MSRRDGPQSGGAPPSAASTAAGFEDPLGVPFSPVEEGAGDASVFSCPLCGNRFSHGGLVCASCPLNLGCEILRCPHCGYQFPRSSKLVDWTRRLVRRASGRRP